MMHRRVLCMACCQEHRVIQEELRQSHTYRRFQLCDIRGQAYCLQKAPPLPRQQAKQHLTTAARRSPRQQQPKKHSPCPYAARADQKAASRLSNRATAKNEMLPLITATANKKRPQQQQKNSTAKKDPPPPRRNRKTTPPPPRSNGNNAGTAINNS